jgi:hypothetical protein
MSEIEKLNTTVDTNDYRFPLETATNNIMTNPFDNANLPDDLPQKEWIEGTIDVLKLVVKDDNIHFSMKLKPNDPDFVTYDAYLGYVKDGVTHKLARTNAAIVATAIGGRIEGRKLVTREGQSTQDEIEKACDLAVKTPCRFQVVTKGEFTNLVKFELLE